MLPPGADAIALASWSRLTLQMTLPENLGSRPDCANIFAKLGVDFNQFMQKLGSAVFKDGTQETTLVSDWVNQPWASAMGLSGRTVQQYFAANPGMTAFSPPRHNEIFLRPSAPVGAGTVAHEVFHKINGILDSDLGAAFPVLEAAAAAAGRGSVWFSDYFYNRCVY
jgi:hypothetical protein